jgi:hypothetical protein
VLRQQGKWVQRRFWQALNLTAGYGYKPIRLVYCYLGMLALSTGVLFWQSLVVTPQPLLPGGPPPQQWYELFGEAFVASLTALHGRRFFQGQLQSGLQSAMVAIDAVAGLLIEASFVATFIQRVFGES